MRTALDPALVEALRGLLEAGHSTYAAARMLGITKNAAIGLKRRHIDGIKETHKAKGAPAAKPRVHRIHPKPIPLVAPAPLPPEAPIPGVRTCQWPISDGRPWVMCGAPSWRGAWCHGHYRRAYVRCPAVAA